MTFKNHKGITETYDLDHDMTKDGALNRNLDAPSPDDAKVLK